MNFTICNIASLSCVLTYQLGIPAVSLVMIKDICALFSRTICLSVIERSYGMHNILNVKQDAA